MLATKNLKEVWHGGQEATVLAGLGAGKAHLVVYRMTG